ncbi:neural Wiskott-Aldrich syndrome protein isoform X2 [Hypomesus transpacificus]|uniref:neural Wiskott-Aldrich syndrome protein isoform X2 n=1 Tax=Hypomesus transpacificus TaxID=137520 RepID=UPI001F083EA9|nr:neural Wiskott-Aldrich syndrome protein isoform X2 [Hypomesus transpacificus]
MLKKEGGMESSEGSGSRVLKTSAVAQVVLASGSGSGHQVWSSRGSGVLCLVKDLSMCSYFLRLYCVKRSTLLWEQELYIQFKYTAVCPFFHTFPSDDCQAGINFADEAEAERFHAAMVKQIQRAQERRSEWTQMTHNNRLQNSAGNFSRQEQGRPGSSTSVHSEHEETMDPETGFSLDNITPSMKKLLREAGFSEEDLKDRNTYKVVCHIIDRFGGLETIQKEMGSKGPGVQTLPRSFGASLTLALKKGPLPPVPSFKPTSRKSLPPSIPQPSSTPPPPPPERIKKSYSCKPMSSPIAGESDLILTSLREAFQKRLKLQHHTGTRSDLSEQDSDCGLKL